MILSKGKKFPILLLILIALPVSRSIQAQESLRLYEKAYKLEKSYPVFSIPIYEESLAKNPDRDLKRIIATRLYFLYGRTNKYPELLSHYSRYSGFLAVGKEHEKKIGELIRAYQINSNQFSAAYTLAVHPTNEKISNLLELLIEQSSASLFQFVYSVLMNRGYFEELRTLMFYLPESIASPIFRIGLLVKSGETETPQVIENYLERESITDSEKSDAFYLYGQYLRSTKRFDESLEYFRKSQQFGNKERANRELGKSLVATGQVNEACKLGPFAKRENSEQDYLLHLICSKTKPTDKELKIAIDLLGEKDNTEFFMNAGYRLFGY
ncbi:hypothetical protein [Leptospira sp. GIMC2001]|uniref:hypothetical protein n=1 Tax=Leptospira sp. GIMC2001 TaxID=1513297 RepID=UPI00234BAEB0|nr:hypothetical protein [Leptospira sp. GIMC2001]WCL49863.1 hypothetical protein O4O04_03330 [Leptospira sp. GIMC2001]